MTSDWYQVVSGGELEQGDVLLRFPIYTVKRLVDETGATAELYEDLRDVVVLTQTCDIENEKIEDILVASVTSYSDAVANAGTAGEYMRSSKFRRDAINGNTPAQALLPAHGSDPALEWSLVDFHHLWTSQLSTAREFAEGAGDRLRLVPPYKEHLAQGFARYIMRVGLPSTLHPFISVKP